MTRSRGRSGRPWIRASHLCYATEDTCWLCGEWVDQLLPPRHPRSRSADHLITLDHGGPEVDRANLRLAHLGCNSVRSNQLRGLPKSRCACRWGQPCAPRAADPAPLSVDLSTL